ncbi:uroporphyrinogen decarboxylase [Rhodoblastus acidophilus]|uniref:uroporphyrinogen decarboxylase family protein n=1 Tax=Rhodoblastus acidophilus TaxID=1074 RepID=UPI00222496D9|nr:uroporphyrinogen decarboxylase family protein [Rhodoblastus acidophilus]MCW2285597.1 uroporphyrinogen decarboxylase [Rhodoblastus acidophilus]MCW2334487.1 uroporphyrinogen decarboxylase [Rhodoblastus acidophilus]
MTISIRTETREELTPLERVVLALQYKKPDRVPAAPLVCGASCRVLGYSYDRWSQDPKVAVASLLAAQDLIEFDGFLTLVDLSVEAEDFGQEVLFPERSTAAPNFDNPFIKTADDYIKVKPVDPRKSRRMSTVIEIVRGLVEARGDRVPTMGFVYGPLGVLSQIRGHAELFKDIIRHPDRVLEAVHTINNVLIEYAKAQIEAGAHAIVLDPLYSSASILKKSTWVKFEAEIFKSVADAIRDAGVPVIVHNCGGGVYFDAVLEHISPIAISHAYPAHGSASWKHHADAWAKKVVSIGVADPAKLGHEFSQAQVLEDCREQIETFGIAEGGFILSSGCEFPPNGNLLSARTMVQAARLYGRY